jgi:hypothetical protein
LAVEQKASTYDDLVALFEPLKNRVIERRLARRISPGGERADL